jgi:hypothetical protein
MRTRINIKCFCSGSSICFEFSILFSLVILAKNMPNTLTSDDPIRKYLQDEDPTR